MSTPARILILEDEPHVARLVAGVLEERGWQVERAEDGREGWARVQRDPRVDLVITDLRMPYLDGFEFLELLRTLPETSRPPCLVLTGVGNARDLRMAMALGAAGVMTKPLRALEVLEAVRDTLHGALRARNMPLATVPPAPTAAPAPNRALDSTEEATR